MVLLEFLLQNKDLVNAIMKRAVESHNVEIIKLFLEHGFDLKTQYGTDDKTLLHIAIEKRDCEIAFLLVNRDTVDLMDFSGNTPLHYAVLSHNSKMVELLLKFKPNIQVINVEGLTARDIAVQCEYENIVNLM